MTDYLEGTMSRPSRLGVRVHLSLCAACRRYVDQMRKTKAFLAAAPAMPPDPETEARLADQAQDVRRDRDT